MALEVGIDCFEERQGNTPFHDSIGLAAGRHLHQADGIEQFASELLLGAS
jgi:hypothetical protein